MITTTTRMTTADAPSAADRLLDSIRWSFTFGDVGSRPRLRRALADTDVRFAVRLTPRAGSDHVDGVVDGVLRVRVAAPAVEGAANQSLLRLLATELGVGRRSVRLVAGAAGRQKLIVVDGLRPEAVVARWPGLKV
jgi:hypothetical protein